MRGLGIYLLLICTEVNHHYTMRQKEFTNNNHFDDHEIQKRQAINVFKYPEKKWPTNMHLVPWYISGFNATEKEIIFDALIYWNRNVDCIKFTVLYDIGGLGFDADIVFVSPGESCNNTVGYKGGISSLSIAHHCISFETTLRVAAQQVGMDYEQKRRDRDENIKILWENIPKDSKYDYTKENDTSTLGPYDFYSLMHFPVKVDGSDKDAFNILKKGIKKEKVGYAKKLSDLDIKKLENLYCDCPKQY